MKPIRFLFTGFLSAGVALLLHAQPRMNDGAALNAKERSIVGISAFTASGDSAALKKALHEGLNAGLTVNAIKEVLVQLYAYAGFPRSLNALQSFMAVVEERAGKGIKDVPGPEPSPLPANKSRNDFGTELQTKLTGRTVKGEVYAFAPAIDQFLKEHLFGDIFGRDNLDWKTRELATISALAALGGVENQLRSHLGVGLYNGLTEAQLTEAVGLLQTMVGMKEGKSAAALLQSVLAERGLSKRPGATATTSVQNGEMLIRLSEIEIHPDSLEAYKTILKEEAAASIELEPGVISIFPMHQKQDSTQIRILEIYRNREAYELHIQSPHFRRYKTATLNMVKSLRLVDMEALDAAGMPALFRKLND